MTRDEVKEWLKRGRDYRYQFITIDTSNKCTLQCSQCVRQWNIAKGIPPGENGKDLPIEDFIKIAKYFDAGSFCGTVSDPIFCENLIPILKIANDHWIVHTAATAKNRPKEWYEEAFKANKNATWYFGIDGLPNESHKYRIGQDGEFLFEMMKLAHNMGLKVKWQYLIFNYNEDHIDKAKELAEKYGIPFEATRTARVDENLRPTKPELQRVYHY